jgi:hypothetical protein
MVNLDGCSEEVSLVLEETKRRQSELDKKMRDAAGSFMAQLLRKLLSLVLTSRRNQGSPLELSNKILCEMLVGNVLLRALQRAQKSAPDASEMEEESDRDTGRFPVEDPDAGFVPAPQGLLGSLPRSVLGECLFCDGGFVTTFLLVVEDFLCSKELADTAAGLTFLSTLLTSFPQLKICTEMDRFGMNELVSHHNVLASNRIAEILSKQLIVGLDVSASGSKGEEATLVAPLGIPRASASSTVVCPKKHTAVLHITRHRSFRCDLCGRGVERGKPMHGCRKCDWDACEDCTDRSESGLVKCSSLRELSTECLRLLSEDAPADGEDDFPCSEVFEELSRKDSSAQLNSLSMGLLERSVEAAKELGLLLNNHGRITFHQFLTVILPALHASFVGSSSGHDNAAPSVASGHRSKKARVTDGSESSSLDSPEARLEYCREALSAMVTELPRKPSSSDGLPALFSFARSETVDLEENNEMSLGSRRDNTSVDLYRYAGASELVRRLHQVLSLYEGVQVISTSAEKVVGSSTDRGGDLQALTKPIEIHLSPSAFNESECVSPRIGSTIFAEPLVPFADLKLHILRTYRLRDPGYLSFCER